MEANQIPESAPLHPEESCPDAQGKKDSVNKSTLPLPVALRNDEISERDGEALFRIAEDPEAKEGRLRRVPRKIPVEEPVPVKK